MSLLFFLPLFVQIYGLLKKKDENTKKNTTVIFAIAGSAGLILLSIFDTLRHPRMHDGFLLLFIAGYVISAILICAEYQRLGIHFRQHRVLRLSFWFKLIFILVEIALAIVFAVCTFTDRKNIGAVFEWVIALVFTGYVLTFLVDLVPAMKDTQAATSAAILAERVEEGADAVVHGGGHEGGNGHAMEERRKVNGIGNQAGHF